MKHRNIMAVIFFSIITLGIYDLFWLVSTKKVLNRDTKQHVPSIWIMFAPVVVFFAAAVAAGVHAAMSSHATTLGSTTTTSSGVGFNVAVIALDAIAIVVLIPITFYWFFKFSKAVNEYTNGEINTAVSFLLLYLLRFIGIAVIQDKFNDMSEAGGQTLSQPETPQTPAVTPSQPGVPPVSPTSFQPISPVTPTPAAPVQPVAEPGVPAPAPESPEQPTPPPQNPTIVQG